MHSSIPPISPATAILGAPVEPLKRLQILTDEEFEQLVEAWAGVLKKRYHSVLRLGGPGDEGLDVVGFATSAKFLGPWDAFQCKRRGSPLAPGDAWVDIGKVIWYVSKGHYTCPRSYAFACNFGIGTSLNKFLANASQLKSKVREVWNTHIAASITAKENVPLKSGVEKAFEAFDFSIFCPLTPVQILRDLEGTAYYLKTFGGGLPPRPSASPVPANIGAHEMVYVDKLRKAYESHLGLPISDIGALAVHRRLARHFEHQRRTFYSAESLREFSKDTVPAGTFEALQQDVEDGVHPVITNSYATQLERLNQVLAHAASLPLTANPLATVATSTDRTGICHQLANDDRIDWDDHD